MISTDDGARAQGRLYKSLALLAARTVDDKKGLDIRLLHIRPVSGLADYMLVAGVTSPPHMRAVEAAVRDALKDAGVPPLHLDGRQSDHWRVIDFGGLIVHLMHATAREYYALERVFHGAKEVSFLEKDPETSPVKRRKAPKSARA